ncbi:MAG: radical SAM protein [Oscillospiraceae bacterium]|nr:radical SAM protein [Oscillospiraceae bacterium]
MKYILNENIALRGWQLIPFAYYIKGHEFAQKLTEEEYFFLASCDGMAEHDPTELADQLLHRGLIRISKDGEQLNSWQKPRYCDNRYFPAVNWSITGKCNYNCKHCFMAADNARLMREFSREEWKKTLDELEMCGVQTFTLTGGEPTLHPDFMEIMHEIHRRGMVVRELNTNGALITRKMLEQLMDMGANPLIKISFDCLGHHDWLRGKAGAEQEALRAIDLCKEMGFSVRIQTCVHRLNIDALYDTAVFMAKKGVEEMRVIRTTESVRMQENAADACLGIEAYYEKALEFTERYAATGLPMSIDIWQFLQFFPKSGTYHYRPVEGGCHSFRESSPVCRGNRGMVAINSDGSVVPCNQMSGYFEARGWDLGNVKRDGLQPLLQRGDYLRSVTCTVGKLFEHNKLCRECAYKKLCMGGCRAIATLFTEDYLGGDPSKCLYFKKGYMQKTDEVFARVAENSGIKYHNIDDVTE